MLGLLPICASFDEFLVVLVAQNGNAKGSFLLFSIVKDNLWVLRGTKCHYYISNEWIVFTTFQTRIFDPRNVRDPIRSPDIFNLYVLIFLTSKYVTAKYDLVLCLKLTYLLMTNYSLTNRLFLTRKAGPRPGYTYPNVINTFSKIEQGRVVDLFRPTSMSCTVKPNISYFLGRMAGMVPILKSTITTNSISWKTNNLPLLPWLWEEYWLVGYLYPTLPSTSTIITQLIEEEKMVSYDLYTSLPTYTTRLREEEWLVKLDPRQWPPKLLEVDWLESWDLCTKFSLTLLLLEEEWLVSIDLYPKMYSPKDTPRTFYSELFLSLLRWREE